MLRYIILKTNSSGLLGISRIYFRIEYNRIIFAKNRNKEIHAKMFC